MNLNRNDKIIGGMFGLPETVVPAGAVCYDFPERNDCVSEKVGNPFQFYVNTKVKVL